MGNYNFELNLQEKNTMSYIDSYISGDSAVLEFGAANGRLTRYLCNEKHCQMTIVEIDEASGKEAAEFAVKSYLGPEVGDINKLVWYDENSKFDFIIFADVLEHLPDPKKILSLCCSMLAEGGKILVSIPNIAHNSILIGLCNDEFAYDEVGLLDKTHIHFFTYKSFYEMIHELGLTIADQKEIYSSVGWNEIKNSYGDVSHDLELALRKRKSGSIYQYVFCLGKSSEEAVGKTFEDIQGYEPDYYKSEEASCFLYDSEESIEPSVRIGKVYPVKQINKLVFECDTVACKARFDVMETSALIKLNAITFEGNGQTAECIDLLRHNADTIMGSMMCFYTQDPWIEVRIPKDMQVVERVIVEFEVLASRFSEPLVDLLETLQQECYKGSLQYHADQELKELQKYSAHLEKDISIQKKYNAQLEKTISEQKAYSEHLEQDIDAQKAYIEHLENDIKALKEHIDKENKRAFWRR